MSTQSSIEDICDQEEDIFEQLGEYDFTSAETRPNSTLAREKAKQQLSVSSDSPFSQNNQELDEAELKRLKKERVAVLKEETNEIRRQLDFVKNRLGELKKTSQSNNKLAQDIQDDPKRMRKVQMESNRDTSSNERVELGKQMVDRRHKTVQSEAETRLRPLTGKADCPNCVCDRRKSVCNKCIAFASPSSISYENNFGANSMGRNHERDRSFYSSVQNEAAIRRNINCSSSNNDERPIRPAKERTIARVEAVNDVVVPSKVYTISKSLNEKRTKLGEAIHDLQLMMEQVREKGDKLNNERKLVQLYKDQWKFGPSIGGPGASSRERLGLMNQKRNYQSRLDPNLNRDTKSVMGFQHIEPLMKLRQYNPKPRPAPRTKIQLGRKQSPKQFMSRSLESLNTRVSLDSKSSKLNTTQKAISNFRNGTASSELNLTSSNLTTSAPPSTAIMEEKSIEEVEEVEEEVEEDIEDKIETSNSLTSKQVELEIDLRDGASQQNSEKSNDEVEERNDSCEDGGQMVKRMTWIPVFGETEIKTVKRPQINRKVQIITPEKGSNPILLGTNNLKMRPQRPTISYKSLGRPQATSKSAISNQNNRVMREAKKKLKFASDLLEKEQSDSGTKNQLIINKSPPIPRPRSSAPTQVRENLNENNLQQMDEKYRISDTNKEIAKLEEMVNEQQKLLNRLAQSQDRQLMVSPITVRCSSPMCCKHTNTTAKGLNTSSLHNNRSLIHSLKERLNKSKTRLAQTLEAEREKHQQLKQKVDSSLRKQTDLESENKILKQSLNKCIDTCLRDISDTFESLSATLNDSFEHSAFVGRQATGDEDLDIASLDNHSSSLLTNAAQLISDNKHLKQMRNHVENIEQQRKSIFEELSKEKQKSNQLESQLKESQLELNQLIDIKNKLEAQIALATNTNQEQKIIKDHQIEQTCSNQTATTIPECQPSTSKSSAPNLSSDNDKSELDTESYNSVEVYRRYIQSMSPDIESLRQQRKLILSEFDDLKKMISDMDK